MKPAAPHPVLTAEALAAMYEQARREYPKECCGIVYGPRDQAVAETVEPCRNLQDDLHAADPAAHPRDAGRAYKIDDNVLLRMNKTFRGDRPAKIIYHSHVNVGAYFSETDQREAQFDGEPWYAVEYVVIDVQADGARAAAQFCWSAEEKRHVEIGRYQASSD